MVVLEQGIALVLGLRCGCAALEKFCIQLEAGRVLVEEYTYVAVLTLAIPLKKASVVFPRVLLSVFGDRSRDYIIDLG